MKFYLAGIVDEPGLEGRKEAILNNHGSVSYRDHGEHTVAMPASSPPSTDLVPMTRDDVRGKKNRMKPTYFFKRSLISVSSVSCFVGAGGAAGGAASSFFLREFMPLIAIKTANATIRKSKTT